MPAAPLVDDNPLHLPPPWRLRCRRAPAPLNYDNGDGPASCFIICCNHLPWKITDRTSKLVFIRVRGGPTTTTTTLLLAAAARRASASTFRICGIELIRKEDAPSSEFLAIGTMDHAALKAGLTFEIHRREGAVVESRRCRRSSDERHGMFEATTYILF